MTRAIGRALWVVSVMLSVSLVGAGSALANGAGFFGEDDDDQVNMGPHYFGFVKDSSGGLVPDAKITANIASQNMSYVFHSDVQGHYFIQGFGTAVDPKDVDITCTKDGFKLVANLKRPPLGTAGIETDFTLDPVKVSDGR